MWYNYSIKFEISLHNKRKGNTRMGRRKNNPDLIEGRWTMDQEEFEEKYNSLSSSDMGIVSEAIYGMEDEYFSQDDDYDDDYDDDDESISVYDAALIWASHGKDEDYTFGYSERELKKALK